MAVCQLSFKPTSAMEMLNLDCSLPIMLFMVLLFSFNDPDSNIVNVKEQAPTIMNITPVLELN